MSRYLVFGRCLESDLPFPELPSGTGPADWVLNTVPGHARPPADACYLGEDAVQGDIRVRLHQTPVGLWLDFDDSGCFEVPVVGRTIRWHRPVTALHEVDVDTAARIDVQGRVLALALHAEGRLCLHGSGVCTGTAGLGFLAPKFHGKSTLALALVSAGARLITDDTLVVDPAPIPLVLPGVHAMRLWSDSARRLIDESIDDSLMSSMDPILDTMLNPQSDPTSGPIMDTVIHATMGDVFADGGKLCLRDLADRRRMQEPTRLAAIYLLAPVSTTFSHHRPAVVRTLLSPTAAALALVGNGKLTPLLGRSQAAVALRRCVDVARAVPVYTLSFARDFDRLHDVVNQLLDWHGDSAAGVPTDVTCDVASSCVASPYVV